MAAAGVGGAADPALASRSSSKKFAPTSTVSPSAAKYLVMTPDEGEVISTVTLSVSILATISSALTNDPGATNSKIYYMLTKEGV